MAPPRPPQDPSGTYMATAGADSQLKVWDVRMLRPMHAYFAHSPVTALDISQRGIMAAGYGRKIQVGHGAKGARHGCTVHRPSRIAVVRVVAARKLAVGYCSSGSPEKAPPVVMTTLREALGRGTGVITQPWLDRGGERRLRRVRFM